VYSLTYPIGDSGVLLDLPYDLPYHNNGEVQNVPCVPEVAGGMHYKTKSNYSHQTFSSKYYSKYHLE